VAAEVFNMPDVRKVWWWTVCWPVENWYNLNYTYQAGTFILHLIVSRMYDFAAVFPSS